MSRRGTWGIGCRGDGGGEGCGGGEWRNIRKGGEGRVRQVAMNRARKATFFFFFFFRDGETAFFSLPYPCSVDPSSAGEKEARARDSGRVAGASHRPASAAEGQGGWRGRGLISRRAEKRSGVTG